MQELWNWGKGANPIPRPLDTDFDFDNDRTDCLETTPEGACVYGRAVAILSSLTVIILVPGIFHLKQLKNWQQET